MQNAIRTFWPAPCCFSSLLKGATESEKTWVHVSSLQRLQSQRLCGLGHRGHGTAGFLHVARAVGWPQAVLPPLAALSRGDCEHVNL